MLSKRQRLECDEDATGAVYLVADQLAGGGCLALATGNCVRTQRR